MKLIAVNRAEVPTPPIISVVIELSREDAEHIARVAPISDRCWTCGRLKQLLWEALNETP